MLATKMPKNTHSFNVIEIVETKMN